MTVEFPDLEQFSDFVERVCTALNEGTPSALMCRRVKRGIELIYNQESCGIHGFDRVALQDSGGFEENVMLAVLGLLNFAQDCIMEGSTEQWPLGVGSQGELAMPAAEVSQGTVLAGYKLGGSWCVQLAPIAIQG